MGLDDNKQASKPSYTQAEAAILTTILYSDIFDFPVTKQELWQYLISKKQIQQTDFEEALGRLLTARVLIHKSGLYCLSGKEKQIAKRKKLLSEVEKKFFLAKRAAYYLSFIPTVRFIGVSGGLAMANVTKEDDVDFFLITQKNTLFVTRVIVLLLLEWRGLRRKRIAKNTSDTICVNFFLDEKQLLFNRGKHDIYIAREIVQVKPLFERGETFQQFLQQNAWVVQFLPNVSLSRKNEGYQWKRDYRSIRFLSVILTGKFFEALFRFLQIYYMKRHKTTETVTNTVLAFHPKDYRTVVLQKLRTKRKEFGLLT